MRGFFLSNIYIYTQMVICIAGLGLIGGSLAKDLKQRGFASRIIGVESNPAHRRLALKQGLVNEIAGLEEAVKAADLIILATPVDAIRQILPKVLDMVKGTNKVVTDTGSTKLCLANITRDHPGRKNYVAAHPMAGTEHSGPRAAINGLFDNKCAIICDGEKSDQASLDLVNSMFGILNMHVILMNSSLHDISAAYVSHISHIASFALSICVQEKEKNEHNILSMAGGGFSSTVRLAASKAETWTPIFEENAEPVLEALDAYIGQLLSFRKHIAGGDTKNITRMIHQANLIQQVINKHP